MNRKQLVAALAEAHYDGDKKAAAHALEAVLDTIVRQMTQGERVMLHGFGTFEKHVHPARWVRHVQTGAPIRARETMVPKFFAGDTFKHAIASAKVSKPTSRGQA